MENDISMESVTILHNNCNIRRVDDPADFNWIRYFFPKYYKIWSTFRAFIDICMLHHHQIL